MKLISKSRKPKSLWDYKYIKMAANWLSMVLRVGEYSSVYEIEARVDVPILHEDSIGNL